MKWKRISPKGRDDLASELVEIVRSGQKVGLDGIAKRGSRREREQGLRLRY